MTAGRVRDGSDRYSRTRLVKELDLERIMHAGICVVGAGALGNEVLKNIVLYGPAKVTVVDRDRVERSNLGRCFLFCSEDAKAGRKKVDAAKASLKRINEEVGVEGVDCDARKLGTGFFKRFDAVVGCMDNILSRLHVNSNCYHAGVPYIDGGLEGLMGRVQVVVPPSGACYQCTTNGTHMSVIDREFTCTGSEALTPSRVVPAEPSVSSVTGSLQSLETVKMLSGRGAGGTMHVYDGSRNLLETIEVEISPGCDNHKGGKHEDN